MVLKSYNFVFNLIDRCNVYLRVLDGCILVLDFVDFICCKVFNCLVV